MTDDTTIKQAAEQVGEQAAYPIRVIEGAQVVFDARPPSWEWTFRDRADQTAINKLFEQAVQDLHDKIIVLKGVPAGRIEYTEYQRCSGCGSTFELNGETGRTACCDRPVK